MNPLFLSLRTSIPTSTKNLAVAFSAMAALAIIGCASAPSQKTDTCLQRRGAIDIGSGSTKAFAAIVNVCQTPKRIVERLYDEKAKVSYGEALERSADKAIPQETAIDGAMKVATFAEEMNAVGIESLDVVATAAFRKAANGPDVALRISNAIADRLGKKTRVDLSKARVQILTQDQEAELGAVSALGNLPLLKSTKAAPSNASDSTISSVMQTVIVWDIGGGSMQMWSAPKKPGAGPEIFNGDLASVTFKNRVIKEIQKKDPAVKTSPNPLKKDAKKAVALARAHAKANVPEFFKSNAQAARWIGIGGVHGISILKQVEKEIEGAELENAYTVQQLAKTLEKRENRTDEEIESEFRATEVTNLALVLGYMQELKIPHVETVEASLVQGLITR